MVHVDRAGHDRYVDPGVAQRAQHVTERVPGGEHHDALRICGLDARDLRAHADVGRAEVLVGDDVQILVLGTRERVLRERVGGEAGRIGRDDHRDAREAFVAHELIDRRNDVRDRDRRSEDVLLSRQQTRRHAEFHRPLVQHQRRFGRARSDVGRAQEHGRILGEDLVRQLYRVDRIGLVVVNVEMHRPAANTAARVGDALIRPQRLRVNLPRICRGSGERQDRIDHVRIARRGRGGADRHRSERERKRAHQPSHHAARPSRSCSSSSRPSKPYAYGCTLPQPAHARSEALNARACSSA